MNKSVLSAVVSNEIIRPRELPRLTGLSRTTIWRLEKHGDFVPKIFLTGTSRGYRRIDIERWIEERIEKGGPQMESK
ncbi:helix-turn-helix transcriptional regulator [Pelobacter propionicus]|uniref:helix-turn-helix transcriptional regulator n=1 Tax=Pelobacter propionicus TaxID=29543 RepID=UPI0009FDDF80|nr:AlpA family phage regulatory protein [Pelobacter propionicus]